MLLELSAVTKLFGAVRALKGVSIDLRGGEVHALLGENGAGKSTLIKVITGAVHPDTGHITIDGRQIDHLNPASARALGIAAIYQQPALFPDLSVAENIAFGLERPSPLRRVRWGTFRARAAELLKWIGAHIDPEAEVKTLSMPEQQLVEMARALGAGARILIMDEPTASLTAKEVDLLFCVVKELRSRDVGIIYISHRLDEIYEIADRVTVLRDGESVGTFAVPRTDRKVKDANRAGIEPGAVISRTDLIRLMVGREISTTPPRTEHTPGAPILVLRNLCCDASNIRNVSLELRSGEILGLAGLVGAGRTELARILFGITPANAGIIELEGKALRIDSPRDALEVGIAYVPEDRRRHGVIMEMAVAANITLALHPRLFRGGWLRFQAERLLAEEYVRALEIKTPSVATVAGHLSGGNQQKVALARWLACRPKILILDEPTQGVDIAAKSEIHKLIRQLAAQGLTVMMISSDLPELLGMSDRIAVMRDRQIVTVLEGEAADAHNVMDAALGQN